MKLIMQTILVVTGLVGLLGVTPAFAQLDELIVTSERREANLQDVPIAVSAFGMDQLENRQIIESQDLQRYVPSLNMFNNITSPTNLSLSLRGGLQQDASLVTAESPIGIYVDDIYVGRLNGNNITLSDIERVEVLRGPQGTLYGRNTAYGAIRYITRTPGDEMWFNASAGVGNFDQIRVKTSVGGPFNDAWAGSFAAQYNNKDGQYFNVAEGTDTDHQENVAMRGKLRYMGSDVFDAVLSVSYAKSQNDSLQLVNGKTPTVQSDCRPGTPGFVVPCTGGVTAQFTSDDIVPTNGEFTTNTAWGQISPPPLGAKPKGETTQTIVGLTLTYDINDNMTFRSVTGYVGLEDFSHTDFNGNSGNTTCTACFPFMAEGFAVTGALDVDSDQFSQEFQLVGTAVDDKLNYLVGVFYLTEDSDQPFGWNLTNGFLFGGGIQDNLPLSQSLIHVETDSISVFSDVSYQFTDNLRGTVGLRWTDDSKDFVYDFESFFLPPFGPQHIELSNDSDELTPRFVLEYAFADSGIMLYGSAAKGFKGGGFSAIAIFGTDPIGSYGSEINWTYEVGMKADWFDHRLRTNLTYFFSDIEDIQQNSTDSTSPALEFPVQNSGDAEIKGLEFEITAVPVDGLNLFLVGSLMDGKFTRLEPDSSAFAATAIFGVSPQTPQTPDYTFDIGFDYTFDFRKKYLGALTLGMDYYKIDNYITAATNDFFNSGWDQLNGFISANVTDNWELSLTGKNLTDEANITSGSRGLGGFIYLPPREYMFTVTYRMK